MHTDRSTALRRARTTLRLAGCVFLLALSSARPRMAVELRGRVVRGSPPAASVPVAEVVVTFRRSTGERSVPVLTGPTGWYGFVGVAPGELTLEVWPDGVHPEAEAPVQAKLTVAGQATTVLAPDLVIP